MRTLVRTARRLKNSTALSGVDEQCGTVRRRMITLAPFSLNFKETGTIPAARFPFIFNNMPVLSIKDKPAPGCIISGRAAGDMSLHSKNRELFFNSIGIPPDKVYGLCQIHSRDVHVLGNSGNNEHSPLPSPASFVKHGDGIVSFVSGVFPAVTAADCLPIFLLDTERGFFAAIHSGWKGTGIIIKALEIMQNAGSRAEDIAAVFGPCIQSCCYKVPEERAKNFEAEFGSASPHIQSPAEYPLGPVFRTDNTGWYINLQAANARLLAAAGVRHIAYCTDCTFSDERLGSFRREGETEFTRMIALLG